MTPHRVEISTDVIYQELADEVVLLDIASDEYFSLDDVGAKVWKLLVEHGEVEAVVAQLSTLYTDVGQETLRRDLLALIEQLREAGLVQVETS